MTSLDSHSIVEHRGNFKVCNMKTSYILFALSKNCHISTLIQPESLNWQLNTKMAQFLIQHQKQFRDFVNSSKLFCCFGWISINKSVGVWIPFNFFAANLNLPKNLGWYQKSSTSASLKLTKSLSNYLESMGTLQTVFNHS